MPSECHNREMKRLPSAHDKRRSSIFMAILYQIFQSRTQTRRWGAVGYRLQAPARFLSVALDDGVYGRVDVGAMPEERDACVGVPLVALLVGAVVEGKLVPERADNPLLVLLAGKTLLERRGEVRLVHFGGNVAFQAGHKQIKSDDVVRLDLNANQVRGILLERAEPRHDFRKQRVRLSEHVLHARHRLYEAVDLRRQLEPELLQFRENRIEAVAGVER